MGNAIGQILPSAVVVALTPTGIIALVLMLVSARGRINGPAFLLSWMASVALVGTVVLLLAGSIGSTSNSSPATWVGILELALGALLLLFAAKQWQGRPRPDAPAEPPPKWMSALDEFSPVKAGGIATLFGGFNPKNLLITAAAALAVAQTGIAGGEQALSMLIFVVIASLGVGTPVVLYYVLGDRSRKMLNSLKIWMTDNATVIVVVILLVIGVKILGDGVSALSN
ncbi:GAP family protein [Jatrophihabitans sp. DSM 45814]